MFCYELFLLVDCENNGELNKKDNIMQIKLLNIVIIVNFVLYLGTK